MGCDLCGTTGKMYRAMIEGTELVVCEDCANYGKILGEVKEEKIEQTTIYEEEELPETIQIIAEDYAQRIKNARENKGLKQEELAKQLREKESQIHKFESGRHKPSMEQARRLEKTLGITLVEQYREKKPKLEQTEAGPLTIGDLIKR